MLDAHLIEALRPFFDRCSIPASERNVVEPDAVIEIAPLLATSAQQLRDRLIEKPQIRGGQAVYLP